MAALSRLRRDRSAALDPVRILLEDPATVRTATDAFALTERIDEPWWPCIASVGTHEIALRMAGMSVPEPQGPWRLGHEPHIWIADRADLATSPGLAHRPLIIGRSQDTVVILNTARAPGPARVEGEQAEALRLRTLLARQLEPVAGRGAEAHEAKPDGTQKTDGADPGASHWPVEVEGQTILVLGLAVAQSFSPAEDELAIALTTLAALPSLQPGPADEASQTKSAELGEWLKAVREAIDGLGAAQPAARPAGKPTATAAATPAIRPVARPATPLANAVGRPGPAPAPAPAARQEPQPAGAAGAGETGGEFEDWASGFAVSSSSSSSSAEAAFNEQSPRQS
jgi:hypothetical protein